MLQCGNSIFNVCLSDLLRSSGTEKESDQTGDGIPFGTDVLLTSGNRGIPPDTLGCKWPWCVDLIYH